MKRLLLVIVFVAVAMLLVLPGALGWVAERGHAQVVDQAQSAGYDIEAEHYQRGWFASKSLHRYRIGDSRLVRAADTWTGESGSDALLIETRLHHGPVPTLVSARPSLTPAWTEASSTLALRGVSGSEYTLPGVLKTRVEADGQSLFEYRAEPGQHTLDSAGVAAWEAAALDVTLNRAGDTAQFEGALDGFTLGDDSAALVLDRLEVTGNQQRTASGAWTGTSAWQLQRLSAPRLDASGLTLQTHVRVIDSGPAYRLVGGVDNISIEEFVGDDARIDLELRQIDGEAVADFLELAVSGRPLDLFEPQQRTLLQRLLAPGPQIDLRDLRVPTGGSAIEGKALVQIAAGARIDGPMARAFEGRADVAVPRELVRSIVANSDDQTRAAIELMIQFGILKTEGDRYRVRAEYADGLLSINGFPVPLPAF